MQHPQFENRPTMSHVLVALGVDPAEVQPPQLRHSRIRKYGSAPSLRLFNLCIELHSLMDAPYRALELCLFMLWRCHDMFTISNIDAMACIFIAINQEHYNHVNLNAFSNMVGVSPVVFSETIQRVLCACSGRVFFPIPIDNLEDRDNIEMFEGRTVRQMENLESLVFQISIQYLTHRSFISLDVKEMAYRIEACVNSIAAPHLNQPIHSETMDVLKEVLQIPQVVRMTKTGYHVARMLERYTQIPSWMYYKCMRTGLYRNDKICIFDILFVACAARLRSENLIYGLACVHSINWRTNSTKKWVHTSYENYHNKLNLPQSRAPIGEKYNNRRNRISAISTLCIGEQYPSSVFFRAVSIMDLHKKRRKRDAANAYVCAALIVESSNKNGALLPACRVCHGHTSAYSPTRQNRIHIAADKIIKETKIVQGPFDILSYYIQDIPQLHQRVAIMCLDHMIRQPPECPAKDYAITAAFASAVPNISDSHVNDMLYANFLAHIYSDGAEYEIDSHY